MPSRSEVGEGNTPEQVRTDALGVISGVGAVARPQGLVCKAGKAHAQRWLSLECVTPTMVVEHGLAHEVVVAMMSVITSRESEGSLGSRGHGMRGDLVSALPWASPPNERSSHAVLDEAGSKPHGGKASDEMRGLEPDWGNLTVRNLRGAEGNLTIGFRGFEVVKAPSVYSTLR